MPGPSLRCCYRLCSIALSHPVSASCAAFSPAAVAPCHSLNSGTYRLKGLQRATLSAENVRALQPPILSAAVHGSASAVAASSLLPSSSSSCPSSSSLLVSLFPSFPRLPTLCNTPPRGARVGSVAAALPAAACGADISPGAFVSLLPLPFATVDAADAVAAAAKATYAKALHRLSSGLAATQPPIRCAAADAVAIIKQSKSSTRPIRYARPTTTTSTPTTDTTTTTTTTVSCVRSESAVYSATTRVPPSTVVPAAASSDWRHRAVPALLTSLRGTPDRAAAAAPKQRVHFAAPRASASAAPTDSRTTSLSAAIEDEKPRDAWCLSPRLKQMHLLVVQRHPFFRFQQLLQLMYGTAKRRQKLSSNSSGDLSVSRPVSFFSFSFSSSSGGSSDSSVYGNRGTGGSHNDLHDFSVSDIVGDTNIMGNSMSDLKRKKEKPQDVYVCVERHGTLARQLSEMRCLGQPLLRDLQQLLLQLYPPLHPSRSSSALSLPPSSSSSSVTAPEAPPNTMKHIRSDNSTSDSSHSPGSSSRSSHTRSNSSSSSPSSSSSHSSSSHRSAFHSRSKESKSSSRDVLIMCGESETNPNDECLRGSVCGSEALPPLEDDGGLLSLQCIGESAHAAGRKGWYTRRLLMATRIDGVSVEALAIVRKKHFSLSISTQVHSVLEALSSVSLSSSAAAAAS